MYLRLAEEWHRPPWELEETLSAEWADRWVAYRLEVEAASKASKGNLLDG